MANTKKQIHISLSETAHKILQNLAESDGLSMSSYLERDLRHTQAKNECDQEYYERMYGGAEDVQAEGEAGKQ